MTTLVPAPGPFTDRLPAREPTDLGRRPVRSGRVPVQDVTLAPPSASPRDPFIDGVRALGTVLVIALHWLMVEATWDGHQLVVGNALSHGAAWLLTWLQPLPLLFFAAGAAARYGLARQPGRSGWRFAASRLVRMAVPVGVFAAVWAVLVLALPVLGVPRAAVDRVARIVPQPLWFLAVQVALLVLTPVLLRALHRWGDARVLVVAAALPLVVDLLRFAGGNHLIGAANVLLVWAVPYLCGLVYAARRSASPGSPSLQPSPPPALLPTSASLPQPRRADRERGTDRERPILTRPVLTLLAGAGLAATVLLLAGGPYPLSLIGMPGDATSNLAPPTAPVVGFSVAQVAVALLLRERLSAWAGRSIVARWVGARSMGLYLWHLTAMFAVTGAVLLGAGEALPVPWTWDWWTTRAGFAVAAALTLSALVAAARRVERLTVRTVTAGAVGPGSRVETAPRSHPPRIYRRIE
jgi:hypothetical protein